MQEGQNITDRPRHNEETRAFAPSDNCGKASTVGGRQSSHSDGLRKQLWNKKLTLQSQMQEVEEAINILDNDETVNKVLKVFDVANR